MNKTKPTHSNTNTIFAIGAGVAAIATASYYFFGPKGEAHREKMKGWMISMKGEIIDRIEDVKELTEPVYHNIVDSVMATYMATTKASKEEVQAFADRLKGQWKEIVASSKEVPKRAIRKVVASKKKK